MNRLSVVIPSKTRSNLEACLAPLGHEASDVIVVDDGVDWAAWAGTTNPGVPVRIVPGVKPFVFSRNVNIGITAAGDSDVVVLNDDAILQTRGGLRLMQQAAEEHPEYGIIGATCDNVGNRNQWPRGVGLRDEPRMVCFVCVLIPRRTIEAVGLLDEEFTEYGFEDDSYCYRVRQAGLKIGILDSCFVDHESLPSTFRNDPKRSTALEPGRQIFIKKWGSYPL
jgi:GT2 family glycosyltransferase